MSAVRERMLAVLDALGWDGAEADRRGAASASLVSKWRKGKGEDVYGAVVATFTRVTGCDGHWLLTEEGEMFRSGAAPKVSTYEAGVLRGLALARIAVEQAATARAAGTAPGSTLAEELRSMDTSSGEEKAS